VHVDKRKTLLLHISKRHAEEKLPHHGIALRFKKLLVLRQKNNPKSGCGCGCHRHATECPVHMLVSMRTLAESN